MVEPVTGGTGPEGQGGVRDGGAGDRAGPSTPPAPDRRVPWLVALLGLAFLGLYLATFTRWYTFDSVAYAENIRTYRASGELRWLFHPHHLLFNVMGLLFQEALQPFHPAITSLTALQVFTAVMGALGVVAFALWAYESLGSAPSALIGAAALGVSYGWWFASTDGRANIASAAMLLVVLWALGRAERNGGGRWTVAAGAFLGLTCLLHESHVFFLPVALVSIAVWSVPRRDRWRNALSFALAFGLSVAVH